MLLDVRGGLRNLSQDRRPPGRLPIPLPNFLFRQEKGSTSWLYPCHQVVPRPAVALKGVE
jgi:hypothetical protein